MAEALLRGADDIDSWTRAFAEEQAKRAGMPVRAWLDEFVAREAGGDADQTPTTAAPAPSAHSQSQPADRVDNGAAADPVNGWSAAREAFGQRASRPEASRSAEAARASAASILARAVDNAAPLPAIRTDINCDSDDPSDELGVRARVSQAQTGARRRLDSDEIERLLGGSVPQDPQEELETQVVLTDVERALRDMREQMDAAAQLSEVTPRGAPDAAMAASAPRAEASTEAIARLGVDIARLVDVMDCGFDRIETASARQTLELRSEVAQMFDELASRIDQFERPPADPVAGVAATDPQAPAADEIGDESAPPVDTAGGEPLDEPVDEAVAPATADSPGLSAPDVERDPPESAAFGDPDFELFEDPPEPSARENVEPRPTEALDPFEALGWRRSDSPALPSADVARQSWEDAQAADDPDSDIFAPTSETAAPNVRVGGAAGAPVDPFEWPTSDAPEPGGDGFAEEGSAAPERHETQGEMAPHEQAPDSEAIIVTRFNPFDREARDDANPAPGGPARRVHFPWLHLGRGGPSRKSA